MTKPFQVMLAEKLEKVGGLEALKFPLYASPKIDGVRGMVRGGVVYSRSNKPIPNKHVQTLFGRPKYEGLDGELVVGAPYAKDCMQATMSGVMSEAGEPIVCFYVFDQYLGEGDNRPWQERAGFLATCRADRIGPSVLAVPQLVCPDHQSVLQLEEKWLSMGYEGIMLRDPSAPYKQGRCGKKAPWLIKVKRFEDAEAEIVDAVERMHNGNEAFTSELGRTKRPTHQENKTGLGDLGALVCVTPKGVRFNIGTGDGLTLEMRKDLWAKHQRGELVGQLAKYKHFAVTGVKDAPRLPVLLGIRDRKDT